MSLRDDVLSIWQAGVDAVRADRLVREQVAVRQGSLSICGESVLLTETGRLAVVGAGKAGAGMALGLEQSLGNLVPPARRTGWVNVPADCLRSTEWIHLHAGRPAGVNAPTEQAVAGTREILRIVGELTPQDVCIILLSGGGSALLVAPIDGLTLVDKQYVTKSLSERGASIEELNCVRRQLSDVKGGGLLRHCGAGAVIVLIISDVIGDRLETIASGPTVPNPTTATDALTVLQRFFPDPDAALDRVRLLLERQQSMTPERSEPLSPDLRGQTATPPRTVRQHVIGNNHIACAAAAEEAEKLGYRVAELGPPEAGIAGDIGRAWAEECLALRNQLRRGDPPVCLIHGGEPVVRLSRTSPSGRGGRNQELVLAAAERLWNEGTANLCLLSGGTDGEDGPTDAAGALLDAELLARARERRLLPEPFLSRHDSYHWFHAVGGLIRTGPTHTNVMDLRVALVASPG